MSGSRSRAVALLAAYGMCTAACALGGEGDWSFAGGLADGGDHEGAAIEFRRIAIGEPDPGVRGRAYWFAAYQYLRLEQAERCDRMLDRSEDAAPPLAPEVALLRGENAVQSRDWNEASFYLRSVLDGKPSAEMREYAVRQLAAADVWRDRPAEARAALRSEGGDPRREELAALDAFEQGGDRSPLVGGMLGLIPGLGYAYSGEYANAVRSLLLNALFGFGLYQAAEHEEWGAFAVIGFFEGTWYTGSVYGGVDAAQRYNRERRESCGAAIRGGASFEPDWGQLPLIRLQYRF